jgi:hypothetical protein
LDDIKEDWKGLRKGVKDVQSQFTVYQQEARSQFDHLRCQSAELQSFLSNTTTIQLNVLRKLLEISSNHLRPRFRPQPIAFCHYPDVPHTVRELWQSASNSWSLLFLVIKFADYYQSSRSRSPLETLFCIRLGTMKRSASDETDRTELADLDIAVAAYPRRCLMA